MALYVIQLDSDDCLIKSYEATVDSPIRTEDEVPKGRVQIVFDNEDIYNEVVSKYETALRSASYTYDHTKKEISIDDTKTIEKCVINEIGFIDKKTEEV